MNQTLVSIIIPAYNCEKTISPVLDALFDQTYKNIEVIVVDDGSVDKTAYLVKSKDKVRYLFQKNAGPAAARNYGAKRSKGEYLLFTDSDCVAHPNWVETMVKHFQDPSVNIVAGSYGIANDKSILARCIHSEIKFRHDKLMPKNPKAFGSYNFGARKNVFEAVGGFNTDYRQASGEDNDLSYKFLKAGHKITFEKNSIVNHFYPTKLFKYLKEQFRHGFWRTKMYKDHPKMAKGDDYTFWKDIFEVLAVLAVAGLYLATLFGPVRLNIWAEVVILALAVIEVYFGFVIVKRFVGAIYFAPVMFLRAFLRTLGLVLGIFKFHIIDRFRKIFGRFKKKK